MGAAGLCWSSTFLFVWLESLASGPPANSDFVSYYVGALLYVGGHSPYDREAELALRTALTGVQMPPEAMLYFLYPPAFLPLVLPLTSLAMREAAAIWGLGLLFTLLITCVVLYRQLPSRAWAAALCWLPAWIPIVSALRFGQISPLLALGLVLVLASASGQRQVRGGLATWLLLAKAQLMLLPVLGLLIGRRWRAVLVSAVGLVLVAAISVGLVGRAGLLAYLDSLAWANSQMSENQMWRISTYSYSWAAIAGRFGANEGPALVLCDGLTLALWAWLGWRRGAEEAIGAAGLAGILISPHAMVYDLCIWLAALPLLGRRPIVISVPLLLGSFLVPWLSNSILGETWPAVLWAAIMLLTLVIVPRSPARAAGVPFSGRTHSQMA